jgi:hypothetical protein
MANPDKELDEVLHNPDVKTDSKQLAVLMQIRNNLIRIHGWVAFMGVVLVLAVIGAVFNACTGLF